MLNAGHQYEEGDVQHWWHEETHRGIRTRFSDDLLWLPYAVVRYIDHTGDESILKEIAPFFRSELWVRRSMSVTNGPFCRGGVVRSLITVSARSIEVRVSGSMTYRSWGSVTGMTA